MQESTPTIDLPRATGGYAALERGGALVPFNFGRRAPRATDIGIDILFCGICQTDLRSIEAWGKEYPLVPGHEIVGRVSTIGSDVTGFAVGDVVAVGTIVDSCRVCDPCRQETESYCEAYPTPTYDSLDRVDGSRTRGGFSDYYVADQRFVHHVPAGLDLAGVAPLLCAGITSYSPLRHWQIGPGKKVGVNGIGGVGHLGVKFAHALGAHVVAFTTSAAKAEEAFRLGADEVVLSSDEAQMAGQALKLDFILDTVSQTYPLTPLLRTLRLDGVLCSLGIPDQFDLRPMMLTLARRSLASSGSGGTRETREMLEFCAERGIVADVEVIGRGEINEAIERLRKGDVRYRFVIDMSKS